MYPLGFEMQLRWSTNANMQRFPQIILIASTLLGSWLGMQAIHETGHVIGARLTHGTVGRVVLHPLTISRTDMVQNPSPLLVVWAGPIFGVTAPLLMWLLTAAMRLPGEFVLRFFAGFCLIANGVYIAIGSLNGIGDSGQMLRHGSAIWQLWLFGLLTAPTGLLLWNKQGPFFGLGVAKGKVHRGVALGSLVACVCLIVLGFVVGE